MSRVLDKSFGHWVEVQAALSSDTHAYPRPDLNALHQYLRNPGAAVLQPDDLNEANIDTSDFILVHNLATGTKTSFGSLPTEIERFAAYTTESGPVLVFLRGHASAQWLEAVAAKFRLTPELYRRHLHWRAFASGDRDLYTLPPLPSWNAQTFQLTISTVCHRGDVSVSVEPEDLQEDRRQGEEQMKQYFRSMRIRARVGDSLVRKYLPFSKQDFVIQQTITVEVLPTDADSWQTIVWLDSGRDLSQSVEGPWKPHAGTPPWQTYFSPIIVQQPADIMRISPNSQDSTHLLPAAVSSQTPSLSLRGTINKLPTEWKAAQNICAHPMQYGSQLKRELASKDALYALSELFQFAASAESQFLNFLRRCIEHELLFVGQDEVGRRNALALMNLKYLMVQSQSRVRHLAETVSVLGNRGWSAWPIAAESPETDGTATRLTVDFKHLLARAKDLVRACESGMDTLANSSVLEETRRSTDSAVRLQKLTVIATVFIPLSFVCSIWGMNFRELGSGNQSLWMYAATAIPVILLSLLIYFYDTLRQQYRKMYTSLDKRA